MKTSKFDSAFTLLGPTWTSQAPIVLSVLEFIGATQDFERNDNREAVAAMFPQFDNQRVLGCLDRIKALSGPAKKGGDSSAKHS